MAQVATLAITVGLVGGLVLAPEPSLNLLWGVLIPLLPVSFLLGTGIWRSICPLATLNMLPNPWAGRRRVSARGARTAGVAGIASLLLLVPARRFLLNNNGPALAAAIAIVALIATALGFLYDSKAGFCNAVCPMLPVERLYGQYPLLKTDNPRCPSCAACTPGTCIDLAPARSLVEAIGPPLTERRWLGRPLGAFAAAFPGFIAGYYTLGDVAASRAGGVYLHVLGFAAGSFVVVGAITMLTELDARVALPLLAATAVGLYYWFSAPLIAIALALPSWAATPIRTAALLLVAVWLSSALTSDNPVVSRPGEAA
ncbi:MAG: hypothetical protein PVJ49_18980 [Acidobacteriota bacterium]